MANKLIPEELNELIQEYLTDGVLTPKEREVILKKAEKLGLDRDEIELYLDAQEQKIEQQTDAAVRKQKSKECPHCGGSMPLLADKCPHCGGFVTPEASKELQEILDNLEEALVDLKSGKDLERSKATVERYARKAKLYYSNNPKIQSLLTEVEDEMTNAEKQFVSKAKKQGIISIISNKWIWVLIEIVIFGLLYLNANLKYNTANENYENLRVLQHAHPDYNEDWKDPSSEYNEIVSKKNNAYDERDSYSSEKGWILFFGIVAIGITGFLAVKDDKKKKA